MDVKIGVLALQGNVSEHLSAFTESLRLLGDGNSARVIPVRDAETIDELDGLAIPGGESTTICRLIDKNRMRPHIQEFDGGIFATCAGMVLISSDTGDPKVHPLGLIDMTVERNAFGRQRESFEADLSIRGLDGRFHAVFIRAPVVTRMGSDCEALSKIDDGIVAVRKGKHIALSFHPELGHDRRLHGLFLEGLGITL